MGRVDNRLRAEGSGLIARWAGLGLERQTG
jgi:hypothetical protein